jgi:Fanconi anemia group M protein
LRSWRVPSQSAPGVEYTVTLSDDGSWSCTCPHFTYRRVICKHILRVMEELSAARTSYVAHPMVREGALEDREYQRRMVERALEANTLVVLPTALGKTVIAELVAAELLHRYPGCRVLIMAPTRPLALQHRESVLKHLRLESYEVAAVTGETAGRQMVWRDPRIRVFTATPQAVLNDYRRGLVRLEEFALLVFDECHRSRSRYAYTRLAEEYVKRCPYPLILALTASPGSEEERVVEVVRNLWIEQILWKTEEDEEVARYIPGVKVSWVRVALPQEYEAIRQEIGRMIASILERLRMGGILRVPREAANRKVLVGLMNRLRAEIEAGVKGPNIHYMTLISAALSLYHAEELIESQHVHSLRRYLEEIEGSELRSHRMIVEMPEYRRLVKMVSECKVDHTKVVALESVLTAHFAEKGEDRVLVFANIRATAEVLVERLREMGYRAALFIGKAEGKQGPRMSQEEQARTLRAFREGVYNVLVATSIGEEGLDIPECGLVIFYEPAVSGIRYIQRRGRTGRRLPGRAVILVAEDTVDEYYFREGYRRAKRMDKILRQASGKTVRLARRAERPRPGTPWPWRAEAGPVIEIGAEDRDRTAESGEQKGGAEEGLSIELPPAPSTHSTSPGEAVKPLEMEELGVEGPSSSELYHCRKSLYMLLLKAGDKGATLQELLEGLDGDYSPGVVRMGLARLVRDGLVKRVGDRYVTAAALRSRPISAEPQGRIRTVEVEKVYPGFAVVIVDDRFRARLEPSAYNGPRELIRKGRRFRARATIAKLDGATTIIVHDVVEAM